VSHCFEFLLCSKFIGIYVRNFEFSKNMLLPSSKQHLSKTKAKFKYPRNTSLRNYVAHSEAKFHQNLLTFDTPNPCLKITICPRSETEIQPIKWPGIYRICMLQPTPWGALHKISSLNLFQTEDTDASYAIMSNAKKVTINTCQQDNTPQMSTQFQTLTDCV
jgi:hypothetical protein